MDVSGDVTFGKSSSDISLVLYGDFKIKAGGQFIIEDGIFTEIQTDVKITDILDISNNGTGPALIVSQHDTNSQDIARFMDGTTEVFVIKDNGNTKVVGDVSMESSLDVSNNLFVRNYLSVADNIVGYANLEIKSTIDGNPDIFQVKNTDGFVGIHTDPSYELDVSGDIHCSGTLFADSDLKIKKNLIPLDGVLDKILKLNGYYYHRIGEDENSLKHIGVIAQEVEVDYPELVSSNTNIKSVNYDGINAILIECVKELRKENIAMKADIEDLRKENILMKTRIEK